MVLRSWIVGVLVVVWMCMFGGVVGSDVTLASPSFSIVGMMNVSNPAFLALSPSGDVVVSQFTGDPFAKDVVSKISPSASSLFNNGFSGASTTPLTTNITWPNTITWVNSSFESSLGENSFLIGGGFLVPPKTVGAVTLLNVGKDWDVVSLETLSTPDGNPITGGWFYHRAMVYDVDGDGKKKEILTARATKPLFGSSKGELVWLEQSKSQSWEEHVLFSGEYSPDIFFIPIDLDGDGCDEILSASYFSGGAVALLYLVDGASTPGHWSNASAIRQVVIDTSLGTMFGLELGDVNLDGKLDLFVTNHVDNATLSGVYAYDIPSQGSWKSPSAWKRHTLASNFPTRIPGPGQASPGAAILFPTSTTPSRILLSGDGAEDFYLLEQVGGQGSWDFSTSTLYQCNGTTGQPLVGDFNHDGSIDALLPCYDKDIVVGVKFQ